MSLLLTGMKSNVLVCSLTTLELFGYILGVRGVKPLDGVRGVPEKLLFLNERRRREKVQG